MSIFSNIIGAVRAVVEGIRNVPITDLFVDLISYVPGIIRDVKNLINTLDNPTVEDKKRLVDDALLEFDNNTGLDGLKLIKGMNPEKIEETLDHFKEFVRNIIYAEIGVEGYSD